MAYMNQDKKAKIAAALKEVVPAGWKYSLAVDNHSTIAMTIQSAPFDLIGVFNDCEGKTYVDVNPYHYARHMHDECVIETFDQIFKCLNLDNFNDSDPMTDYYHVGHYVSLQIGKWNKPFQVTGLLSAA